MINEIFASIISIIMIFLGTTFGCLVVFFLNKKTLSDKFRALVLGLASGIMIAASFFGLLLPAIEEAKNTDLYKNISFVPVVIGFLLGCLFLSLIDKLVPHFHQNSNKEEGIPTKQMSKQTKFFLAVTIHNVPEGLAVGFACALALQYKTDASIMSLLSLAIGITIQNIPEGAAVSIPYYELGKSKTKSFLLGTLTGVVEPLAAIIGLLLASSMSFLLPWLLAFASGMMIFVTVDELLPDSVFNDNSHIGIWSFIIGFAIMMILEMVL
ncbi:MAG: ZIP family metal transporter [Bacilli bacterium]